MCTQQDNDTTNTRTVSIQSHPLFTHISIYNWENPTQLSYLQQHEVGKYISFVFYNWWNVYRGVTVIISKIFDGTLCHTQDMHKFTLYRFKIESKCPCQYILELNRPNTTHRARSLTRTTQCVMAKYWEHTSSAAFQRIVRSLSPAIMPTANLNNINLSLISCF